MSHDIDHHDVCCEMVRIFDGGLRATLMDFGYIPKDKMSIRPEGYDLEIRQQAIAKSIRIAQNEYVLDFLFQSPLYKSLSNRLSELLQGWDRALVSNYLAEYDFQFEPEAIRSSISQLINATPSDFDYWLAIELPGYHDQVSVKISDSCQIVPKSQRFFEGHRLDFSWPGTKYIPSIESLDHGNCLLLRKVENPFAMIETPNPTDSVSLILQLSPLAMRAYESYAIVEDKSTGAWRVRPNPMRLSVFRLRIPVPQGYMNDFEADVSWLLEHARKLDTQAKARIALQRYAFATYYYTSALDPGVEFDEAINHAVIGLETLFVNSREGVSKLFRSTLAKLMEESPRSADDYLRRIYRLRSDVAHTGETRPGNHALNSDVFSAIALLNAGIRWYLSKAESMTEHQIVVYLTELATGKQKDIARSLWGTVSVTRSNPPTERGPWTDTTGIK